MANKKEIKSFVASLISGISNDPVSRDATEKLLKIAEKKLSKKAFKKLKRDVVKGIEKNATKLLDSLSLASAKKSADIKKRQKAKERKLKEKSSKKTKTKQKIGKKVKKRKFKRTTGVYPKFEKTIANILKDYDHREVPFRNGPDISREAGQDVKSSMIFALMRKDHLSKPQTLLKFAEVWEEVKNDPEGSSHPNVRAFLKYGHAGIVFPKGNGLTKKK